MSLRVGELLILGFHGTELPDWLIAFEAEFGLGGVILFDRDLEKKTDLRNIESPDQVQTLCNQIHTLDSRPLVFVDQEGGRVLRLKPARGFAPLPSAAETSRLDEAEARRLIQASYTELAELGIDFNLAPVVDLNINPDNPNIGKIERSFSEDPAEVRRCVQLFVDAAERVGLQLCLKHYPGLGGAVTDSHGAVTDISSTLSESQLALFLELCPKIPGAAILLSHGIVQDWDPDWPVSISVPGIARLRNTLPDALLITDDIQMQGLQAFCPTPQASQRALAAGIDLVCIGNNLRNEVGECRMVAEQIMARAENDPKFQTQIGEAIARVEKRKRAAKQARA